MLQCIGLYKFNLKRAHLLVSALKSVCEVKRNMLTGQNISSSSNVGETEEEKVCCNS